MGRLSYKLSNPDVNRVVCGRCETRHHTSYTACPECSGGTLGGPLNGKWLSVEPDPVRIVGRGQGGSD